jgi:Tfp pilus assembly protein PilF
MTFITVNSGTTPAVSTNPATNVSYFTATLNGKLSSVGSATSVSVYFNYGTTTSYGTIIAASTPSMTATGAFSINLTGLQPNTTYHFEAYVDGGTFGTSTGTDMTFTTPAISPPQVNTSSQVSGITGTSAIIGGYLISLGTASSVNVSFKYGTTPSFIASTTVVTTMTAPGAFNLNITGLNPYTTYYFESYADGGPHGTATGAVMTFTTGVNSSILYTSTNPATNVSYFSATLNGTLSSIGSVTTVNVYFNYGTDTNYGTTVAASPATMTAIGAFSVNITGLQPNTTYHFITYIDGGTFGTAIGNDATFTTPATIPPQVNTISQTANVTATTATLNGLLASLGTASSVNVYFKYGTTTSYGTTVAATPATMTSSGAFTGNLTGLRPNTLYHFAAYADGGLHGKSIGADMTFTTPLGPPAFSNPISGVNGYTTITLTGNLTSLGTATSVNVSFNYATDTYYTANGNTYNNQTSAQTMTAIGPFTFVVTGLNPGTFYHFQVVGNGGINGTFYGSDMLFLTKPPTAPSVSTAAATGITTGGATFNGNLTSLGSATSVNVSFNYATDTYYTANGNTYNNQTSAQTMTAIGPFTFVITGFNPGTEYHVQAVANGGKYSTKYGSDLTFTTTSITTTTNTNTTNTTTTTTTVTTAVTGTGTVDVSNDISASGKFVAPVILSSADNNATISIPAGISATTSSGAPLTSVTVTQLSQPPASSPAGTKIISTSYEFGPSGTKFNSPITMTFNYSPTQLESGFSATSLVIAYYDVSEGKWVTLGGTVHTANHTITVQVNHFTAFAVIQQLTTTTPIPGHKSYTMTWIIIAVVVVIILIILALYYLMKNRIPKANSPIKKEVNEYVAYTSIYNDGLNFYNNSDYDKAINSFTKCVNEKPNLIFAYCLRGSAYYALGQMEAAMEDFKKAISIDPKNARAYYGRALIYLTEGNETEALNDFNMVIILTKDHELIDIVKQKYQEINGKH